MRGSKRSNELEFLDLGPDYYSEEEYRDCLVQLNKINRLLGGEQATLKAFSRFDHVKSILDVGCGGGNLAILLAKKYPKAHVVGVDISPNAIEIAQNNAQNEQIKNIAFQVAKLSDLKEHFDIITSNLVCHHMDDQKLVEFLQDGYRMAKKGLIINDLHRHRLAYGGFDLLTRLFFSNRLIKHDGLVSIERGFKKKEWLNYLKQADIPLEKCSIQWKWAFRWIVQIKL